jgi:agmatinase
MNGQDAGQSPWNFLGLPDEQTQPERARAWVLPVPYEATTSYGKGTRGGPEAIVAASHQVELYDREFGCEPASRFGVHTLPPLDPSGASPESAIDRVADAVETILTGSPAPDLLALLGGEHSLSAGVARGTARALGADGLVAVQVDAHADLRQAYEGTPYSHACAARRIVETCPIFQIGVRNVSEEGDAFRRGASDVHTVFAEDIRADGTWLDRLARFVRGKTVFLTVDVDGLDPAIMPAVGTPEPDGLSWHHMLDVARTLVREAASCPVFDIVELAPIAGMPAPDFLCAKLAYKIMCLALMPGTKAQDNATRKRKGSR